MTSLLPPIPPSLVQDRAAGAWLREVARRITAAVAVAWGTIDFTTSSLSDITTRPHSALTNILGADNTSTDATQNKHVSNADMKTIADRAVAVGTAISGSLGADVALNNVANYFDGPSVAQGTSGTWFVTGTVSLQDTAGTAAFGAKLWDGTTLIDSCAVSTSAASLFAAVTLSGFIAAPAGNLRISARDFSSISGKIVFNATGLSKDSSITAIRVK